VLVAGASGSGKTTVATRVAAALELPRLEIDGLYHGPGWVPRPTFVEDVHRFAAGEAWVVEWQYDAVRPHLLDRADTLVWLDLPRPLVMRQVVRRTLRRRLRRERLWNGNLEPPLRTIVTDREHIVRWAWTTHGRTAPRVLVAAQERPDLVVVRLRTRAEVEQWLVSLSP
jgi:adenylate kinase family enzyme